MNIYKIYNYIILPVSSRGSCIETGHSGQRGFCAFHQFHHVDVPIPPPARYFSADSSCYLAKTTFHCTISSMLPPFTCTCILLGAETALCTPTPLYLCLPSPHVRQYRRQIRLIDGNAKFLSFKKI
jgi:hypothetical protein